MKACTLKKPASTNWEGSLAATQVSIPGVPSIVEVWTHCWLSVGTARTPYFPGYRFLMMTLPVLSVKIPLPSATMV